MHALLAVLAVLALRASGNGEWGIVKAISRRSVSRVHVNLTMVLRESNCSFSPLAPSP